MASSFLLARGTGAAAFRLSRSGTRMRGITSLFLRRTLSSSALSSGNDPQGLRKNAIPDGKLFSSSASLGDKTSRTPLEELAGSMGSGPGRGGLNIGVKSPMQASTLNWGASTAAAGDIFRAKVTAGGEAKAKSEAKGPWFKETSDKVVGYWLLGSAGLVFGIVVLGGLTRLTESGLSITEWKPVTGSLPPLSQADWEESFAKYKDSPEYRVLNPHMTLEEFKFIYYMEWAHRLWGRVIGLSFVLPASYFIARGRVSRRMALKLVGISGLIGFQGFIGWWMVKSGLKDDLFTTPGNTIPRVSQYRLTAHLCTAFTVYLAMLYNGLSILRSHRLLSDPTSALSELRSRTDPRMALLRRTVLGLALLAFITAMSGGLVAGLDAGLIYNDFPKMGTGYKPPNSELFNPFYSRDKENHSDLWWRNMLENPSLVQFQHRCLAITTFSAVVAFWLYSRFGRARVGIKLWELLNKRMRSGVNGVLHLALLQVSLGISTLIYMVPTPLAVAHQAGSLALLTGIMVLANRVFPVSPRVVRLLGTNMGNSLNASKAAVGAGNPNPGRVPISRVNSRTVLSSVGSISLRPTATATATTTPTTTPTPTATPLYSPMVIRKRAQKPTTVTPPVFSSPPAAPKRLTVPPSHSVYTPPSKFTSPPSTSPPLKPPPKPAPATASTRSRNPQQNSEMQKKQRPKRVRFVFPTPITPQGDKSDGTRHR